VLLIPGLWNSGPLHWQTEWERLHPDWRRVNQRDFDRPEPQEWARVLDDAIRCCATPPVLAAHSLGCSLVAHWSLRYGGRGVAAAMLVAPSDVEAESYPEEGRAFKAMTLQRLPFRSLLVTSTNDAYVTIERAREFSAAWGSEFLSIGEAGHINGASGYGRWAEGESLLLALATSPRGPQALSPGFSAAQTPSR